MAENVNKREVTTTGREISRKVQFYGLSIKVSAKRGKDNYVQLKSNEILQLFNKIKELSKELPKEISRETLQEKVPEEVLKNAFEESIPEKIKLEDITEIEVERELLKDSAFIPMYEFTRTEERENEESQARTNTRPPKKYLFMRFPSLQDDSKEFDGTLTYPIRGQLIMSRADALPLIIKNNGQSEDLEIPEDALGLGEITHFMIFKDGTVLLEFNPHGPRARLFEKYLREKLKLIFEQYPDGLENIIKRVDGAEDRGIRYILAELSPYSNNELIKELKAKNVKFKSISFAIAAFSEIEVEELSEDDLEEPPTTGGPLSLIRGIKKYYKEQGIPLPDGIYLTIKSSEGYTVDEVLEFKWAFEKEALAKKRGKEGLTKLEVETFNYDHYDLLAPLIETKIVATTEKPQSKKLVSRILYQKMEKAYNSFAEQRL
ncbi:hypothetical protein [Thermococcus sp. GR4]|uniref:hypothetical protein n=1 Tax=Thermococcus sp. GR4 TaxID=1638254 RepID=UPI001431A054|nr:hypothetical protein [Thermococcus sp. GR4]NJE79416.1 hypothetical protein [Thermococcus sp. GR4]